MLNITKTHTSVEKNANETINYTTYEVDGNVKLAMDSIWDYDGSDTVAVKSIQVIETVDSEENDSNYKMVNVEHDDTWKIYTSQEQRRKAEEREHMALKIQGRIRIKQVGTIKIHILKYITHYDIL